MPIKNHEATEEEVLTKIGYLELREKRARGRFYSEIRRVEHLIGQFPESGKEVRPGIRKRMLRKFRYSLVYSREKEGLLILAVAHHSRLPECWVGRFKNADKEMKGDA
ncbi:MAG: type II toxin-antitoxin system RelE/ParE family toxin [Nitrospira sp.]|nr:type II toxin-antitoxin system RelE/ParE family toxin [Nitrospira sp.]